MLFWLAVVLGTLNGREFVVVFSLLNMAQSKLNDLAGRLGQNPKGLGLGLKILAVVGASAYGISQSMFTGKPTTKVMYYTKPVTLP